MQMIHFWETGLEAQGCALSLTCSDPMMVALLPSAAAACPSCQGGILPSNPNTV